MTETKAQEAGKSDVLQYSGGIYALLGHDLRLFDENEQLRSTYLQEQSHSPYLVWPATVDYDVTTQNLEASIVNNVVTVGTFNEGYIDLVKSTQTDEVCQLVGFWRRARELGAYVYGMPDMKAVRKAPGMRQFCVVPLSVAIVAYLAGRETERLLVPARLVYAGLGQVRGCRALMPLDCLLEGVS